MSLRQHCIALLVLLAGSAPSSTRAQPAPDDGPPPQPTVNPELRRLTEQYGAAAVELQGYLLAHAISAGSQLEITVAIAGMGSRGGRDYLEYDLDTGIVYQAAELTTREQLSRIWTDVIDPSLRKAALAQLRGEGLTLRVRSYRGQFADRAAIMRELEAQRVQRVDMRFILPLDAVRAFIDGKVTPSELSTRGTVELDGVATQLEIMPTPVPEDPTAAP